MVNIILLFKNALRYCPARWIRLKVGSLERSLLIGEARVNLLKSFNYMPYLFSQKWLYPEITAFLAVGSGVAGFLRFFGSFHTISSPCWAPLLNGRIAHPHLRATLYPHQGAVWLSRVQHGSDRVQCGSVGSVLTCSSSNLGSAPHGGSTHWADSCEEMEIGLTDTESRRLPAWVRESTTPRIGDTGSR